MRSSKMEAGSMASPSGILSPLKEKSSASSVQDHSSPCARAKTSLARFSFLPTSSEAFASAAWVGMPFLIEVSNAPAPSATSVSGPSMNSAKSPSFDAGSSPFRSSWYCQSHVRKFCPRVPDGSEESTSGERVRFGTAAGSSSKSVAAAVSGLSGMGSKPMAFAKKPRKRSIWWADVAVV